MAMILLNGTEGDDLLVGADGNDYAFDGHGGHDTLIGANGDDLFMYHGTDTPADDTLDGGAGFDDIILFTSAGQSLGLTVTDALRHNIEQVTGMDGNEYFDGSGLTSGITLDGEGGNDVLLGGHGDDIMLGGSGDDELIGNGGTNILLGGDGDDAFSYFGGHMPSNDILDGGDGFDDIMIHSAAGSEVVVNLTDAMRTNIEQLTGGDGTDIFDGSALTSGITLNGEAGDDNLKGGDGDDILLGGSGDDALNGHGGRDFLFGGDGDDLFVYSHGDSPANDALLDGGAGYDQVFLMSGSGDRLSLTLTDALLTSIEQVTGNGGDEAFYGGALTQSITLDGGGGDDYLEGGHGDDLLIGGSGDDFLNGKGGSDKLMAGDGDDYFIFDRGDSPANDAALDGGAGVDQIYFMSATGDTLSLTLTDEMLTNIEKVSGNGGDESFYGAQLTKGIALDGGGGNDYLEGGAGDDVLFGGTGGDFLQGNGGADVFVMQGAGGKWTVADFTHGQDHIQIIAEPSVDFEYVMENAVQLDGDTQITIDGSTMILKNVALSTLTPADFFFGL